MKKILLALALFSLLSCNASTYENGEHHFDFKVRELKKMGVIANTPIDYQELEVKEEMMGAIYKKVLKGIEEGKGPFYAEVYDKNGKLIASSFDSVEKTNVATNHAVINALKLASKKLKKSDLTQEGLAVYTNAEPCMMCVGALLQAGVRVIYFGVPANDVPELMTGFENYKLSWIEEFKKRDITVYGGIERKDGVKVLKSYFDKNKMFEVMP